MRQVCQVQVRKLKCRTKSAGPWAPVYVHDVKTQHELQGKEIEASGPA
jgi:hypothetical protein